MLALALIVLGQAWTVDDDGPADFSSLQAAVDAVAPGDTLLVHAGSYGAVDVDKPLAIVAASGAPFDVSQLTIHDAASFTLAGARVATWLTVARVPGRGVVEDVQAGSLGSAYCWPTDAMVGGAYFDDCGELVVGRSSFHGSDGYYPDAVAGPSAWVLRSTAAFYDCSLEGGQAEVCYDSHPSEGGDGAFVDLGSLALFSGCRLVGGRGNSDSIFAGVTDGGPGLLVRDSTVDVRGSSADLLSGGESYQLHVPVGPTQNVVVLGASQVAVSGVSVVPSALPPGVSVPQPALPYLLLTGSSAPGGVRTLELYGPAGSPAVAAASLVPALFVAPVLAPEAIWLHPSGIVDLVGLVTAGQDTAVTHRWSLPATPAVAGLAVHVQAWVASGSSPAHFTQPGGIALRW